MAATSTPAPVGGWNAKDALSAMPATDAVVLRNWIPRAGYVQTRRGRAQHVTGLGGSVDTLVSYSGLSGSVLIAGAAGKLWNVTTAGGVPASLATGFTNNRWQTTNHSARLILTNGADTPQVFNGTTMAAANFTGSPAGLTPATLWGCATFKGRVFYWSQNEQRMWYAGPGGYQGALAEFNFQTQLTRGGTLVQVLAWTLDSGTGVDDLAAFVFSSGEVLVYQGDDPGAANAWKLIGRFLIGAPLGIRAHEKVGGTEIILTRDGYVDLGVALKDARYSEETAYSAKIIKATKAAAQEFGGFFGWQAVLHSAGNLFIVNVPTSATTAKQHVRETSTGAWCEFTGWDMLTFTTHNNRLYGGDASGVVWWCDVGTSDNGARIESWALPAFNSLGNRASRKQLTAAAVVSTAVRPASYALDGLADQATGPLRASLQDDAGSAPAVWDTSAWDTSAWALGDDQPTTRAWRNCAAVGNTISVSVRIRQRAQLINWYATNVAYNNAGVI